MSQYVIVSHIFLFLFLFAAAAAAVHAPTAEFSERAGSFEISNGAEAHVLALVLPAKPIVSIQTLVSASTLLRRQQTCILPLLPSIVHLVTAWAGDGHAHERWAGQCYIQCYIQLLDHSLGWM
jgi:hypothetical protein